MNKHEFLKKLQSALRWAFTHEEIADILSDYEDFFVTGSGEGKSEQEICKGLGDPSIIAKDLVEALGKKQKRPLPAKTIGRMALTTALLIIGLVYYYAAYQSGNIFRNSSIWVITFTIVLWFVLGGTIKGLPPISRPAGKSCKWIFVSHAMLLCVVGSFFAVLHRVYIILLNGTLGNPERLGQFLSVLHLFLAIAVILISVWSFYCFYRRSPYFFTVSCHAIGVIAYLSEAYNFLNNLSDPTGFNKSILMFFIVYGVSIALTIIFALLIRTYLRRAK